MLKKATAAILLIAVVFTMTSCFTHKHIVGNGPRGNTVVTERQWYVLWGLVPLNNPDTKAMAGGAQDYEITTQTSFLDIIINIFTGYITIYSRTIEVRK